MSTGKCKLTLALTKKICAHLELLVPFQYALAAAGIGRQTGYDWLTKGRDGDPRYVAFAEAVEVAKAKAICKAHVTLLSGSKDAVKGVMFLLERLHPAIYGLNVAPAEDDRRALEIVQRRLDPVTVPVDRDGRVVSSADVVVIAERFVSDAQ